MPFSINSGSVYLDSKIRFQLRLGVVVQMSFWKEALAPNLSELCE